MALTERALVLIFVLQISFCIIRICLNLAVDECCQPQVSQSDLKESIMINEVKFKNTSTRRNEP